MKENETNCAALEEISQQQQQQQTTKNRNQFCSWDVLPGREGVVEQLIYILLGKIF